MIAIPKMTNTQPPYRILIVDDEAGVAGDTADVLTLAGESGKLPERVDAAPETSFHKALDTLSHGRIDLLVLDVLDQGTVGSFLESESPDPIGRTTFRQIRSQRFVPVIFVTALPREVEDLIDPPFVQVVSKRVSDPMDALIKCVKLWMTSQFPQLYRMLQLHIDTISRDFMIEFVEKNWNTLKDQSGDVAYLLMRRLGVSFDSGSAYLEHVLESGTTAGGRIRPISYYVVPPPDEFRMGQILAQAAANDEGHSTPDTRYIVLTPTCDLVEARVKAEVVVLAECKLLSEFQEYTKWIESSKKSKGARANLMQLLKSNPKGGQRNRYYYLPAALKLPDMMVDLQRISHIPYSNLVDYTTEACLDSPFAEALSHQFHSYMGRVATPGLDLNAQIGRM